MAVSQNFAKGVYFLLAKLAKANWIWLDFFTFSLNGYSISLSLEWPQIRHSKRPITTWLTTKKGIDKDAQEVRWVRRVGYGEERVSGPVGGGTGPAPNGLVDGCKALPQVTVADQGVRQQVTARRKQNYGYGVTSAALWSDIYKRPTKFRIIIIIIISLFS